MGVAKKARGKSAGAARKKKPAAKKAVRRKVKRAVSIFSKPKPKVSEPAKPAKPKKNYKLPNYKKKCIDCAQFKFIKGGWSLCMQCYEKRYGKYLGEDRFLYVQQK